MLTIEQRVKNYNTQELHRVGLARTCPNLVSEFSGQYRDLTPRQQRRVIKKLLKATKVRTAVTDESNNRLVLAAIERLESCPTCQATGDSPCVTKSGNPAKKPHANRPAIAGKE